MPAPFAYATNPNNALGIVFEPSFEYATAGVPDFHDTDSDSQSPLVVPPSYPSSSSTPYSTTRYLPLPPPHCLPSDWSLSYITSSPSTSAPLHEPPPLGVSDQSPSPPPPSSYFPIFQGPFGPTFAPSSPFSYSPHHRHSTLSTSADEQYPAFEAAPPSPLSPFIQPLPPVGFSTSSPRPYSPSYTTALDRYAPAPSAPNAARRSRVLLDLPSLPFTPDPTPSPVLAEAMASVAVSKANPQSFTLPPNPPPNNTILSEETYNALLASLASVITASPTPLSPTTYNFMPVGRSPLASASPLKEDALCPGSTRPCTKRKLEEQAEACQVGTGGAGEDRGESSVEELRECHSERHSLGLQLDLGEEPGLWAQRTGKAWVKLECARSEVCRQWMLNHNLLTQEDVRMMEKMASLPQWGLERCDGTGECEDA
ncbi:hypothetical protein IAT38_002713 [Cryptococcus sp. DSM 104549]